MTIVGGHKRKAWRLKKKYNKWFREVLRNLVDVTLQDLPEEFFEISFSNYQDYEFIRLYK